MRLKTVLLWGLLTSTALLGCATEDGFTPITDDREDNTNQLYESQFPCLEKDGCDMLFHLSYAGSERTELDVTIIDPTTEYVLVNAVALYSYDPLTNRSTWSLPYWDGSVGDYTALARSKTTALREVEFEWEYGKPAYSDRFNPAIGQSCVLDLSCPGDLECLKLKEGIGQGYTCVTRCFTDSQCSNVCEAPPTGDLAVERLKGVCSSSAISG